MADTAPLTIRIADLDETVAMVKSIADERDKAANEAARLRSFVHELAFSHSHVNDNGEPLAWDEHLHDPAPEGGHRYCGPCSAFRLLGASS